jgi:hypothetical protein
MLREYTQMRDDASEHPLDIYNELSKAQQRLFTFLIKRCNNQNQYKITGVEIAEQMSVRAQHVSSDIMNIMGLDMIRKGKYSMLMINPYLWFFGDRPSRSRAISSWDALPQISSRAIVGNIRHYRAP